MSYFFYIFKYREPSLIKLWRESLMDDLTDIVILYDKSTGQILDIDFYFDGYENPFCVEEFWVGSRTRVILEYIEGLLYESWEAFLNSQKFPD